MLHHALVMVTPGKSTLAYWGTLKLRQGHLCKATTSFPKGSRYKYIGIGEFGVWRGGGGGDSTGMLYLYPGGHHHLIIALHIIHPFIAFFIIV